MSNTINNGQTEEMNRLEAWRTTIHEETGLTYEEVARQRWVKWRALPEMTRITLQIIYDGCYCCDLEDCEDKDGNPLETDIEKMYEIQDLLDLYEELDADGKGDQKAIQSLIEAGL